MGFQVPYDVRLSACGVKHLALYQAIRDSIVDGRLPRGTKLPSTRALAASYGLSRGSVSVAYEMLAAEGYVNSSVGQGTYVAGAEERAPRSGPGFSSTDALPAGTMKPPRLSAWGSRLLQEAADKADKADMRPQVSGGPSTPDEPHTRDASVAGGDRSDAESNIASAGNFATSSSVASTGSLSSDTDIVSFLPRGMGEQWFPWMSWKAAVSAEWRRRGPSEAADQGDAAGSAVLRRAIAGRLRRERGILCEAEDIVVTGGSMQAITLLAQLLLEPGKAAVVEDPCFSGMQRAVRASGAALLPAPVDRHGIVPDDWRADLLFVTPTRQFPTGAVLTYERRLALLEWAQRRGAWIVEDDYDSEFRWAGRPIEPLKSLDREARVVYVGSFSRTMRQEVRIGYAVLPSALREPFLLAKQLYETHPAGLTEQRTLADWMSQGEYDRHLRRTRRIFHRLQEKLREELESLDLFDVHPADAGLLLFASWKGAPERYDRYSEACRMGGVSWGDGSAYAAAPRPHERTALFGFAHLDEDGIEEGMRLMRETAERLAKTGETKDIKEKGGAWHA